MDFKFYWYVEREPEINRPKIGLNWFFYNPAPSVLQQRNRFRKRSNMDTYKTLGKDFTITLLIGRLDLTFMIIFEHPQLES